MNITELNTRYFFFTGKGGVGKTSISCATAIAEVCDKLAQRVALVPWMSEPPTGAAGLRALVEGRESTSAQSARRVSA